MQQSFQDCWAALEVDNIPLSIGWRPGGPHKPLLKTVPPTQAVYQMIGGLFLFVGKLRFHVIISALSVTTREIAMRCVHNEKLG